MIDIGSAAALVSSLKTAAEITKGIIGLRDASMIQDKVVELNGVILSAQSSALEANAAQFNLLDRVRELEEEIARMKTWDTEKQKYELKQIQAGAFAYVLKPTASGGEPAHWLCAACYQQNNKSILQAQGRTSDRSFQLYGCPTCKATLRVHYNLHPGTPKGDRTF